MTALLDISGNRFTRLVVIRRAEGTGRVKWECICDCGASTVVDGTAPRTGHTKSCGCLVREQIRRVSLRHGHAAPGARSPTWRSWSSMLTRCTNQNVRSYPAYGGRGISVCKRWRDSFVAFLSDMGERPVGRTIDRIDVNGNYEPGNCRWATATEQSRNKSLTILTEDSVNEIRGRFEHGEPQTSIARRFGVSKSTVHLIIKRKSWENVP